jgi:hypothetical protein
MKYEKPELTVLMTAIRAIQDTSGSKVVQSHPDGIKPDDAGQGYADWE